MNKHLYITIFTVLTLLSLQVSAQQYASTKKTDTLNCRLIEDLIKNKIDSVRIHHKRLALTSNDTLKVAASDHAAYLKKKKTLSHFQSGNSKKKSPMDRVVFYGLRKMTVGENIAFTFIHINIQNKNGNVYVNNDETDIANDFIKMWVKSKGHYANIINPKFNLTGVAVSYDPVTNKIYAVQDFSSEK